MINIYNNYIYDVLKMWGGKNEEERIILAILEEAGKLAGKIKKRLRGDDVSDNDIKKEFGDLIYYLRIHQYKKNLHFPFIKTKKYNTFLEGITDFYNSFLLYESLGKDYWSMTLCSYFSLVVFFNFDFEEIINMNISKLQDRQKRNGIKGSGDNR